MGTNLRTSQDIQDDRYIFVPIYFSQKYKKRPPPHFFLFPKKSWPQMTPNVMKRPEMQKKYYQKTTPPHFFDPPKKVGLK